VNHRVSYYALEGVTGQLRWQRTGAGEEDEKAYLIEGVNITNHPKARPEPDEMWKMEAALDSGHFEQAVWHKYRYSILFL
jgi:hypothetical protein